MPGPITSVLTAIDKGHEGQLWPTYPHAIDTRIAEAIIKPGRIITSVGATIDRGVLLPTTALGITTAGQVGVALWNPARTEDDASYIVAEPLSRILKGRFWMLAEDAVTEGEQPWVRFVAGGGEELGRVRSDADTADAALLPTGVFRSSTSGADELVIVEINLA